MRATEGSRIHKVNKNWAEKGYFQVCHTSNQWNFSKKNTECFFKSCIKIRLNHFSIINELWLIWLGGGKGYFRHSSKLFYIKGIAVGPPPISYHFWVCWWTSFSEKLRPLRLEVAEICWGCWKQPQAHKNFIHKQKLAF